MITPSDEKVVETSDESVIGQSPRRILHAEHERVDVRDERRGEWAAPEQEKAQGAGATTRDPGPPEAAPEDA